MKAEIANIVDRVLLCGLDLKDRLEKGENRDLAVEQHQLRVLLKSAEEARRWPEYGGDGQADGMGFLGMRYALVCWLDEIFSRDSPWAKQWTEQVFEYEMYRTRERYEAFWEQARRAEARPDPDALEAYYLCAMLGFRGQKAGSPQELRAWADRMEPRLTRGYDKGYNLPPAKVPPCNVPPLTGRDRLRTIFLIGLALTAVFLVLLPIVVLMLVK
jgi:type VI secretion system protein ImpK